MCLAVALQTIRTRISTKQSRQTLTPVLWQKDFHRIVYSDDAEYIARLIDNGKRQQIIFSNSLGDVSRRFERISSLKLRAHHFFKRHRRIREYQTPQCYYAQQLPRVFFLDDVEVVDHVWRFRHLTQSRKRLADGERAWQRDELRRHQSARG